MRKAQSTKIAEPIPAEFEQVFIHHGWDRANRIFGKRATTRYYTALGPDRLRAERGAYLQASRSAVPVRRSAGATPARLLGV
jgi:hypothetical protein